MNRYRAYLLSEELLHDLALLVYLVVARAERSARLVRMAASVPGRSPRACDTSTSAKAASCPSLGLPEPLDLCLSSAALASLSPSTRAGVGVPRWQGSMPVPRALIGRHEAEIARTCQLPSYEGYGCP